MSFVEMADLVRAVERETKTPVADATYHATGSSVDLRVHVDPDNYAAAWVSIPTAMAPFVDGSPMPVVTNRGQLSLSWSGTGNGAGVVVSIPLDPRAVLDDVAEHLGWDIIANTGTTATIVEPEGEAALSAVRLGVHVHLDQVSGLLTFAHDATVSTAPLADGLEDVTATFTEILEGLNYVVCDHCVKVHARYAGCEGDDLCRPCYVEHLSRCVACRNEES